MTKRLALIALIIFAASLSSAFAHEFYISPGGDDNGTGTRESPFKTLSQARDAVRQVNRTMTNDIVVYLRGGEYQMTGVVDFGTQDSGFNGHRVIYKAFEDETPILTGGIYLTGWTLHDPEKNIYRADAPKERFRQLYTNGKPGIRARTTNRESSTTFGPYWPVQVPEKPKLLIDKKHWEPAKVSAVLTRWKW